MKKKPSSIFRVRVGEAYCSLSHDFHELGCLIPDVSLEDAHIFTRLNTANYAVARTVEVANQVRRSMIPDFKNLRPLLFEGVLVIERINGESVSVVGPAAKS